MSLLIKYLLFFTLFLIAGSFFATKFSYAQDVTPQIASRHIPFIDPQFAQIANKLTRYTDLCPKINNPMISRCLGKMIVDDGSTPFISTKPAGFGPAEFRKAYGITGDSKKTTVVAIIDAYDQPNILSDLQIYSSTFNLPQLTDCTGTIIKSTLPCFKKVDQTGGTNYPSTDSGWALEISLDIEAVHAVCDNCSILLVEAKSASNTDLLKAVDTAVNLGATIISNSYGSGEAASETQSDSHFNQPGIAIFASAGDSGYGVSYPAASRYVIGVGGTKLNLTSTGAYSSESAWSDGGSGCSSYETKPSWQHDTGCKKRTVADIAADADPMSGAAVYDSVKYNNKKGWFKIGGTSLSSPLIAGIFATGDQLSTSQQAGSFFYGLSSNHFHDITKGSNGFCTPSYLCKATTGYDGPTGLGSPNGEF
ncbi:MAG TPA: S53 family peptidase [Candidatus Saccharimonadales bacterium]|nr:S53 family peptidase [Candidatus Saccharimonadales bacterium]